MKCIYKLSKLIVIFVLLFYCGYVSGQDTTLMYATGHKDTTASYLLVYDDGGKDNHHSNHCDATYTIHTSNSGNRFFIKVKSYLDWGNDGVAFVEIIDGDTNDNNILFHDAYGFNNVMYSTGDVVSIRFKSDDDNPQQGFEIEMTECSLPAPTEVDYERISPTSIKLTWEESDTALHWIIDYVECNMQGHGNLTDGFVYCDDIKTVYSDTNFVVITGLDPYKLVSFNVHAQSQDGIEGCGGLLGYCPCYYPDSLTINQDEDSVYINWHEADTSITWTVHFWGQGLEESAHVDTNYYSYPINCEHNFKSLYVHGNCDVYSSYYGTSSEWCDAFYNEPTELQFKCPNVSDVRTRAVSKNSITVAFPPIDSIDTYIVGYRKTTETEFLYDTVEKGNEDMVVCLIDSLEENTAYIVTVYAFCDDMHISCGTSERISTTFDNCLDFTNIISMSTFLTWGNYDDPYMDTTNSNYRYEGTNDWFYGTDRHVVFNDTSVYDGNTNWALRCVPEDEIASVRLGNANVNREAESISYEYTVDTNESDMLILKYAVVMQDPGHTKENQPRFTLEILDENGGTIDTACCFADFYAAGDLGWNTVVGSGSNIIWKDWTTVGIDIAPYHEQTIRIRLTTYDCNDGGHFAYAYFNIKCDNKKIYVLNRCDAKDSVWLQAPLGFDYYWHKHGEEDTLSKSFEVKVPIDDNVYECVASFIGKPDCNFTISTIPVAIVPVSQGSYTIDTCNSQVTFVSTSYMDFDETLGAITHQFRDTTYWIAEDGSIFYGDTLVRNFPNNGDYTIKLITKLSDSQCRDTMSFPVRIDFHNLLNIEGKESICATEADTLTITGIVDDSTTFVWNTQDTHENIIVTPLNDATYSVYTLSKNGCKDSVFKHITVNPVYDDTITSVIIQGQIYHQNGFNENTTGIYTHSYQSMDGCDSIVTLNLRVLPTYDTTIQASICEEDVYIYKDTFYYSESGTYIDTVVYSDYAQIYTFNITVNPIRSIEQSLTACVGDTIHFHGQDIFRTGSYIAFLQTDKECDSLVLLDVVFNYVTHSNVVVNLCPNKPYELSHQTIYAEGLYFDTLQTALGCDSVLHVHAVMNELKDTSFATTICEGESYDFCGDILHTNGTYSRILETEFGCDSLIELDLEVIPTVETNLTQNICENEFYVFNSRELNESGFYSDTLESVMGCDSVVSLNLKVSPLHYTDKDVMLKKGDSILLGDIVIKQEGRYSYTYTSIDGCDSVVTLNITCITNDLYTVGDSFSVLIHPNPTKDIATVEINGAVSDVKIVISDVFGKVISTIKATPSNNALIIDLKDFAAGSYYVTIYCNGYTKTQKLLKTSN